MNLSGQAPEGRREPVTCDYSSRSDQKAPSGPRDSQGATEAFRMRVRSGMESGQKVHGKLL